MESRRSPHGGAADKRSKPRAVRLWARRRCEDQTMLERAVRSHRCASIQCKRPNWQTHGQATHVSCSSGWGSSLREGYSHGIAPSDC